MRRRVATAVVAFALAGLAGCGGGGGDPPPTTVTTQPAPTTTIEQGDAQGIACLKVATAALKVVNDYRAQPLNGVAAPEVEPYRTMAEALREEHARLGCPGVILKGFLTG